MKRILLLTILLLFSVWAVSADMSDSLFCLVRKDTVVISLKKTTGYYNCKDTIASLEQLIIKTAKDLMKVQIYINNGRDVSYRETIKTEKQSLIDTLLLSKKAIVTNMNTFQTNLLQKSVQYFIIKNTPYKISLQKSLAKIDILTASGFSTPSLASYEKLLKAQVATLESFNKISTTQELNELIKKYVYLKKEIVWRYE